VGDAVDVGIFDGESVGFDEKFHFFDDGAVGSIDDVCDVDDSRGVIVFEFGWRMVFPEGNCDGETGGLGVKDDDIISYSGTSHFIEIDCKTGVAGRAVVCGKI
jgi:hypothetical protein